MRSYHFNNMYMHGIHAGIQSKHAGDEITLKTLAANSEGQGTYARESYLDWMANHKTVVVLNAGMHGDLLKIEAFLSGEQNPYAWGSFKESEYALNNAMTNIAIILPEHIYGFKQGVLAASERMWSDVHELISLEDGGYSISAGAGYISLQRMLNKEKTEYRYSKFDLDLIRLMAPMKLM
jgi:hypothetical protein